MIRGYLEELTGSVTRTKLLLRTEPSCMGKQEVLS
jgi:hypothetical protein